MITYVWAATENHAVERAYECHDYEDLAEAMHKAPPKDSKWLLYKLEVSRVTEEALS